MTDRLFLLKAIAVTACAVIIVFAFSLYRKDAENVTVTIGFGEIVELQIGNSDESSTEVSGLAPESSGSITIALGHEKYNDDKSDDEYTYGKFYIEVVQKTPAAGDGKKLSDELEITAKCESETITSDKIVKKGEAEPVGFVKELTEKAIQITLTYSLSETAKDDFLDYAGQEVTIIAHWVKTTAPLKVHIKRTTNSAKVYCEFIDIDNNNQNKTVDLSYPADVYWKEIIVYRNYSKVKVSKTESYDDYIEIVLSKYKVNEIWVTLEDNGGISTTEPSEQ